MIVVSTLQAYRAGGYTLMAHCERQTGPEVFCGHSAPLDLDKLIELLGPDYDAVENRDHFLSLLRCESCGHKGCVTTRLHPPHSMPSRRNIG